MDYKQFIAEARKNKKMEPQYFKVGAFSFVTTILAGIFIAVCFESLVFRHVLRTGLFLIVLFFAQLIVRSLFTFRLEKAAVKSYLEQQLDEKEDQLSALKKVMRDIPNQSALEQKQQKYLREIASIEIALRQVSQMKSFNQIAT